MELAHKITVTFCAFLALLDVLAGFYALADGDMNGYWYSVCWALYQCALIEGLIIVHRRVQ